MSFYLVRLDPDGEGFVENPVEDYGPYESGGEAAKVAKKLSEAFGVKVQPRRIRQAPDWRERQRNRLADGTLRPLPKKWDLDPIPDHFAHLSKKDPTKIAFTEDDEKGILDRATVVTPGRYLARFYPELSDAETRRLVALVDTFGEIRFATTPEEITRVYTTGPHSCMSKEYKSFPIHPAAVYAAGDLAVAYMLNPKSRSISSRAVCWPERKLYGRIYGDIERLKRKFEEEGYRSLDRANENFVGARLLKVLYPGDTGRFIMPYFDDIEHAVDAGEFFITADDPGKQTHVGGGGVGGLSYLLRWCPKLEQHMAASTFSHVNGVDEEWSGVAIAGHAFTCAITGGVWPNDYRAFDDQGRTVLRTLPEAVNRQRPAALNKIAA